MHLTEKKTAAFNFETALQELETIVKHMEEGNISLEESLKYFEKGITLTRQCQTALKEAEQKVQILMGNNSEVTLQAYKANIDDTVGSEDEK